MNRLEVLRDYIDEVLLNMEDVVERRCGYIHLYGVAQFCTLIALKRGENVELATMAGMLHDIYSYVNRNTKGHAHKGAILAKEILTGLNIATKEETDLICSAIYNHSDKKNVDTPFDEVLKDADVLQHCLYNTSFEVVKKERERFEKLKKEFALD